MKKTLAIIVALAMALALFIVPMTASAGTTTNGSGSYNGLTYQVYVPSNYSSDKAVPMYVMLHGCTQTASAFASVTGMNSLADEKGFIVVYVQQSSSNNMNSCFNWFETGDQSRNGGEPKDIYNIVNKVMSSYNIDKSMIFAAGFSAGAYMTPVLGATYPDLYSGIVVNSGGAYKSATSMTSAFTVMSSGATTATSTIASNIVKAMGSYKRVIPCIVFQGTSDFTVGQKNGQQAAESWAIAMNSIDSSVSKTVTSTVNGKTSAGTSYTRSSYTNANGVEVVALYLISGMGHAWSGGNSGSYSYPSGPSASKLSYEFFTNFWSNTPTTHAEGETAEAGGGSGSGTGTGTIGGFDFSSLPGMSGIDLSGMMGGLDLSSMMGGFDMSSMMGGFDLSSMMGGFDMSSMMGGFDMSSMMGGFDMSSMMGGYDWSSLMGSFDMSQWTGGYDWSSMMGDWSGMFDLSQWTGGFDWSSIMGSFDWSDWFSSYTGNWSDMFGSFDYSNWWSGWFGDTTDSWMDMWSGSFSGWDDITSAYGDV